jgi:ribosomal protein L40E
MPLVQCTQDSSVTATGWEIGTDTDLDGERVFIFILLIIPAILLICSLAKASFTTLRNISITGALAKLIAIIVLYTNYADYYRATVYTWLILFIYIGLCIFTHYYKDNEDTYVQSTPSQRSPSNYVGPNKKCRRCNKIFSGTYTGCPHCGSSLYEETNQKSVNFDETWICKECGERNPNTALSCKGCGAYK